MFADTIHIMGEDLKALNRKRCSMKRRIRGTECYIITYDFVRNNGCYVLYPINGAIDICSDCTTINTLTFTIYTLFRKSSFRPKGLEHLPSKLN